MSSGLARYVVRRSIQSIFLLILISVIAFSIMRMAPGGPFQFLDDPRIGPEYRAQIMESFGLNEPIPVQYARWLWNVARLDFGYSFIDRRPVIEKIAERVPASFQLASAQFVLGLAGIPLGIFAAVHRGRWQDQGIRVFTVLGNAVPHWWLGLMMLVLFAASFRMFPLGGMQTIGDGSLPDRLWHLTLPALVGAFGGWITYSRFVRSEVLDILGQDYVRTAHAKGLGTRMVLFSHALRNALIPLVTMFGGILTLVISGSVLFETTFSWPGLGRMTFDAANQRDYPVLMAMTIISSALAITGNLLADITYGWVDPRVRYE